MTQPDDKRENSPAGDSSENDSSRTRTRTRTRRRDESSSSETAKSGASNGSDAPSSSGSGDATSKDDSSGGRSSSRSRRSRGGSGRSGAGSEAKTDTSGSAAKGEAEASKKDGSPDRKTSSGGGRSRSKDASSEDAKSGSDGDAKKGSSGGSGSKGSSDDDDSTSSNRRRRGRRGRRGRGRGRGGEDGGSENKGSSKGSSSDASSEKPSRSSSSKKGDTGGKGDDAVKDAIEKGGTRMAAKRGSSRGGGSRSSSRGGGGGGSRGGGRHQRPTGVSEEVRRAILDGPPRSMLVTSTEERTQIAVLEDRTVVEHHVTRKQDVTYVGNIYMARVQNVLPGMEAAFLDIGKGRNGVLYAGEVLYDELDVEESVENPRIEDALKQGQKVLVQVTKDPMGSKGPRLTMHLSLAGRYMVLAPNSDLFGISRKLTDKERDRLRRIVKKVKPDHHGVIVRTAAENATEEQLTADLERLLKKWEKAEKKAGNAKALTPVYEEPSLVVKVIRDNFGPEFERCVVDSPELYVQVCDYLEEVAPELLAKVELYGQKKKPEPEPGAETPGDAPEPTTEADEATGDDATAASAEADPSSDEGEQAEPSTEDAAPKAEAPSSDAKAEAPEAESSDSDDDAGERELPEVDTTNLAPLFDSYHVNEQLRKAMGRKVWLPSGGYLIIESTEAMKVIDVNTGKFTGDAKSNLEEVVLKTNLEAAEEIVRQLRLRDLGGIIVIDFIDMLLKTNQDQVVRKLKRELLRDRTKTRVSEVSRLGLVQMTRKNVSQGLVEAFSHKCESCEGHGYINELDD